MQLNKAVTESQDEIADLKEKMRALTHQFDQMKEEIIAKVYILHIVLATLLFHDFSYPLIL